MSAEILSRLETLRLLPVIVIDDPEHAAPLGAALAAGGLPCAEVTLRTRSALEALRRLTGEHPSLLTGAGTVLTPSQAAEAREAGAQFIVAPGFSPAVVDYCLDHDLPVFPGVCTPTEIEAALARGLTTLKFFPAEPMGGVSFLKAIAAPYGDVRFMPTGGITAVNLAPYLRFDRVVACGGSWMAPRDWIAAGDFGRVQAATTEAMAAVRAALSPTGGVA
jgi:2-dehydro-3-deoxyphosphogluconate aldolase/(4S)-4-hydroxy-2-oxoglutarate aldolase